MVARREKLKAKKADKEKPGGGGAKDKPGVAVEAAAARIPRRKKHEEGCEAAAAAPASRQRGGMGGGGARGVSGAKESKWSGKAMGVKEELEELYSAVGLSLKLHLQHGRDIRELQFRNGQTAIVVDKDNSGIERIQQAKEISFQELREEQEKAKQEARDMQMNGTVEADCFTEMLEWMSEMTKMTKMTMTKMTMTINITC